MTAGQRETSRAAPVIGVGGVLLERIEGVDHVLLIRRRYPPSAGAWSLPGGRVEFGEALATAVVREVKEETGLDVRVEKLVELVEIIDPPHHFVVADYLCERYGGELSAGDDALDAMFAPIAKLEALGASEKVIAVVAKALALR